MAQAGPRSRAGASRPNAIPGKRIVTLLTAAVFAAGLLGCGLGSEATTGGASLAPVAELETAAPPPDRQVQVVVDPSGSVPRHYLLASLKALAGAVLAIPQPLPTTGPSPARPAVSITVRAVAVNSYSPSGRLVTGTVGAIPEIAALPEETDVDLTGAAVEVAKQREEAEQAATAAEADAESLAEEIGALDPPVTGCSDIAGSVSASAQSFTSSDRRLVMVTDLAQHCPANVAGSLRGAKVLIVHICETASRCQAQQDLWRRRLTNRGAASVRFVRIENMSATLRSFIAGD